MRPAKVSFVILALFVVYPLAGQTEPRIAFKVHVVNSLTGTSIAGANVMLSHEEEPALSGRTDAAAGIFTGSARSPGTYLLNVTLRGYRQDGAGMGNIVEIRAGANAGVTLKMLPLGVIAGRVLDQYGDPVRHAIVRTEDKVNVADQDEYESYAAANTDDLGEYRIAEVQPGMHYVAVEYNSKDEETRSGIRSRYRWPQRAGPVLYPDATDIEQAQQVEVTAGATTRLNDARLKIMGAVAIMGRIKPSPTEKTASVNLERIGKLGLHSSPIYQAGSSEVDGSFNIAVPLPGKYLLTAVDSKTGKMSKPLALNVGEKDITGLELELTSGYEINGRVSVTGSDRIDLSKLVLNFGGPPVKIDANGAFQTNLFAEKAVTGCRVFRMIGT